MNSRIFALLLLLVIVWVPLRGAMIMKLEGPKIIRELEAFKKQNGAYPESLGQMGIKSFFSPWYSRSSIEKQRESLDRRNQYIRDARLSPQQLEAEKKSINSDEFDLTYSIFVFYRCSYSSKRGEWFCWD